MSVDNRIVNMEFNNKDFERNINESINSLNNLKKCLEFDDASKSLSRLEQECSKFNLNPISDATDKVAERFSIMEIVGTAAIWKITNQAMDAGSKLVKSLSVDQLTAGWSKYEEKTTAVQTILSATAEKGENISSVNAQLSKLLWFTDETSYSFVDMTSNIGKFTAQGVDLGTAVTAMEGISTWAALSGQNIQSASRAMYNLSQAIGVGSVKLMDWRSIENANMATTKFKQTVLDTGVELGKLKKTADGVYETLDDGTEITIENFSSTLSKNWFDKDILLETLDKFGGFADELNKATKKTGLTATELLRYINEYERGMLDLSSVAEDTEVSVDDLRVVFDKLTDEEYKLGRQAFRAAQEAKTWSEVVSATKDAVSTKWLSIFETIFGDYEEVKVMWTDMANEFWEIFAGPVEELGDLVGGAFKSGWEQMTDAIAEAGGNVTDFESAVKDSAKASGIKIDEIIDEYGSLDKAFQNGALGVDIIDKAIIGTNAELEGHEEAIDSVLTKYNDLHKIVDEVIRGDYNNVDSGRIEAIEAMGYDFEFIQDLVNQQLWYGEFSLDNLTDEQAKAIGYTEEQIAEYQELSDILKENNINLGDYYNALTRVSGRTLFSESLLNIVEAIRGAIDLVREAYENVFPVTTSEMIYNWLVKFHDFTEKLIQPLVAINTKEEELTDELRKAKSVYESIREALEGFFSLLSIGKNIISGIIRGLQPIFSLFGTLAKGLLNTAGGISSVIKSVDAAIKENNIFYTATKFIAEKIAAVIRYIILGIQQLIGYYQSFTGMTIGDTFIRIGEKISQAFNFITTAINSFIQMRKQKKAESIDETMGLTGSNPSLWESIISFLGRLTVVFDGLWSIVQTVGLVIGDAVWTGLDWICDIISSAFNLITSALNGFNSTKENLDDRSLGSATGLDKVKPTVWQRIANFLTMVSDAIASLWFAVKGFVGSIVDGIIGLFNGIKNALSNVGSTFDNTISSVGNFFGSIIGWIVKFVAGDGKDVPGLFERIRLSIEHLYNTISGNSKWDSFGDVVVGVLGAITGAIADLWNKIGGLSGIKDKFSSFFDGVKEKFEPLKPIFQAVSEAIKNSLDKIFGKLRELAQNEAFLKALAGGGIAGILVWLLSLVTKIVNFVRNPFGLTDGLKGILDGVADVLKSYQKDIKSKVIKSIAVSLLMLSVGMLILSKVDSDSILSSARAFALLIGTLAAAMKIMNGTNFTNLFSLSFSKNKGGLFSGSENGVGTTLRQMATSVLILSAALMILSKIPTDKVEGNLGIIVALIASLAVAGKLMGGSKANIKGFTSMSVGILILIGVLKILTSVNPSDFQTSLTMMLELLASILLMFKLVDQNGKIGGKIIGISVGLLIIVNALMLLSLVKDTATLKTNVETLSALLVSVFGMFALAGKITSNGGYGVAKMAKNLLPFAAGLLLLVVALKSISKAQNVGGMIAASISILVFIGVLMKIFGDAGSNIKPKTIESTGNMLTQMAKAMIIMVGAMAGFAAVNALFGSENALVGILELGVALAAIMVTMKAFVDISKQVDSKDMKKYSENFTSFAGGLLILSGALTVFSIAIGVIAYASKNFKFGNTVAGLGFVIVILGGLIFALAKLVNNSGSIDSKAIQKFADSFRSLAVSMIYFAGAIAILSGVIAGFAALMSTDKINFGTLLLALLPLLIVMAAAVAGMVLLTKNANKLGDTADGIKKFAESLEALGKALLKISLGLLALGLVGPILAFVIFALDKLGVNIEEFAARAVILIFDVLMTILDQLAFSSGRIVADILIFLEEVLAAIALYSGPIVAKALAIIYEVLYAVGEALPDLIASLVGLLIGVIDGLIAAAPTLTEKLWVLVLTLVQGLVDAIYNHVDELANLISTAVETVIYAALTSVGGIFEGFFNGLDSFGRWLNGEKPKTEPGNKNVANYEAYVDKLKAEKDEIVETTEEAADEVSNATADMNDTLDKNNVHYGSVSKNRANEKAYVDSLKSDAKEITSELQTVPKEIEGSTSSLNNLANSKAGSLLDAFLSTNKKTKSAYRTIKTVATETGVIEKNTSKTSETLEDTFDTVADGNKNLKKTDSILSGINDIDLSDSGTMKSFFEEFIEDSGLTGEASAEELVANWNDYIGSTDVESLEIEDQEVEVVVDTTQVDKAAQEIEEKIPERREVDISYTSGEVPEPEADVDSFIDVTEEAIEEQDELLTKYADNPFFAATSKRQDEIVERQSRKNEPKIGNTNFGRWLKQFGEDYANSEMSKYPTIFGYLADKARQGVSSAFKQADYNDAMSRLFETGEDTLMQMFNDFYTIGIDPFTAFGIENDGSIEAVNELYEALTSLFSSDFDNDILESPEKLAGILYNGYDSDLMVGIQLVKFFNGANPYDVLASTLLEGRTQFNSGLPLDMFFPTDEEAAEKAEHWMNIYEATKRLKTAQTIDPALAQTTAPYEEDASEKADAWMDRYYAEKRKQTVLGADPALAQAQAGVGLVDTTGVVSGIDTGVKAIKNALTSAYITALNGATMQSSSMAISSGSRVSSDVATGMRRKYSMFLSAGTYCFEGFVKGFETASHSQAYKIGDVATQMALLYAENSGVRSPSWLYANIGSYCMQGFINGFTANSTENEKTIGDQAKATVDAFQYAMSSITDADAYNTTPLLTPVVDLSNARQRASELNSMFNGRSTALADAAFNQNGSRSGDSIVVNMNVYGAQGQDVNELARIVSDKINASILKTRRTWA